MKKVLSIVVCMALAFVMLVGCASPTNAPADSTAASTVSTAPATTAPAVTDAAVLTGLAVVTSIASSTAPTDKDPGLAEADSTVAAVTVDNDGKILKCVIDAMQTKANFDKTGKITTDLKTAFKSKQELKTEYGMAKSSKIGKEWNEQADAFAAYVVGKTFADVKGIKVNADGYADVAELSSSVTVHIGDFINAVSLAVANAQDVGAKSSDKLGLAITSSIAGSTEPVVKDKKDGQIQAYNYYTASTFSADGKVTSSLLDASQANVTFDATGKITVADLKAAVKSKNDLGTKYGMGKVSKIGLEWNVQAANFAKYATGKSIADLKGIAVNADGAATSAELTSSVTVDILPLVAVLEKASTTAK